MHMKNLIPFQNIKNFRDLGGYKNRFGKTIKNGIFYRSGHLNTISEEEKLKLKELGIKTIFDYRSDKEFELRPTPTLDGIALNRICAINIEGNTGFGSLDDMLQKAMRNELSFDLIINLYKHLPFNNPSYEKLVELIKNKDNLSILQHCAAGKDRTGIGSAIILMLLGCDRETIIEDYLFSNEALKDDIENILKPIIPKVTEDQLKVIQGMIGVELQFIEASLNQIEEKYSDYDKYLIEEFDLTMEDIEDIRSKYTE